MARFVFARNVSLDGYVDHDAFAPGPGLFRHWIEVVRGLAGSVYGRRVCALMRYWEEDRPEWGADERDFAQAWRGQLKWVLSGLPTAVGPNATLVADDAEAALREVKARRAGEVAVAGPETARRLGDLGLIDEYRLYVHPVALGGGTPFFAGPRPRLVGSERIGEEVVRLAYSPR